MHRVIGRWMRKLPPSAHLLPYRCGWRTTLEQVDVYEPWCWQAAMTSLELLWVMADVQNSSHNSGEEPGIANKSDTSRDNMFLMDEYDKAALEVFQEYGVHPEAPAEDDCLNPVYR